MDTNGLFYYIGTDGGSKPYENPISTGKVKVKMSTRGGSDFYCIADRNPRSGTIENSYGDDAAPWVSLHFKHYKIHLTAYVICQERDHLLRTWNMLGSNDGVSWELIEARKNDMTLTEANPQAVFHVSPSVSESRYYSHLRLQCTGPSHKGSTDFDISQMEFYGLLQVEPASGVPGSGNKNTNKLVKQKGKYGLEGSELSMPGGGEPIPVQLKSDRRVPAKR